MKSEMTNTSERRRMLFIAVRRRMERSVAVPVGAAGIEHVAAMRRT